MNRNRKWTVYFELFGKKMKTEVEADSMYAAQCKVKDRIIFHKTEDKGPVLGDDFDVDRFKEIFGIK